MNLALVHNVYFIGVGGIGMSALARYFHAHGKKVAGYDKTATPLTAELEALGIQIHYNDAIDAVPERFLDKSNSLIVYTPAIPSSHRELNYFKTRDFAVLKRAEVLGIITQNSFCFAVAGTHGKTTTSSILGHIMAPKDATAFLGGIAQNYQSNLILGGDKVSVVEADEYDRSFLQLAPDIACVTSMDADHLDIYKQASVLEESFEAFAALVSQQLVVANGLPLEGITYGLEDDAQYTAQNIAIVNGDYVFDIVTPEDRMDAVLFSLPGRHNLMNAMAAVTMAHLYGVSLEDIKESLATFSGVARRFSYKIKTNDLVLIDDYAHHPTEITVVAHSIREMYNNKKSLVVFQPHLYSRTQDFVEDFAKALALFDHVLLLPIYPARELPISGVSSHWLLEKIELESKKMTSKNTLVEDIKMLHVEVVAMLGAGDIGLLVDSVSAALKKLCQNEA